MPAPFLIFGLGNPGPEYEKTYHNAGVMALEVLDGLLSQGASQASRGAYGQFSYARFPNAILASSETYMNESGLAVAEALRFFKIPPESLVLLHDDSDLPLGEWKLEGARGAGGHHGVESVIQVLGTTDMLRGRVGVRSPLFETPRKKAGEFVLKKISSEDAAVLEIVFDNLTQELIKLTEKT